MTPYEIHASLNHSPMSRYSPNSVDIIEECDCGQRWIHNPSIGYPVTLPAKPSQAEQNRIDDWQTTYSVWCD